MAVAGVAAFWSYSHEDNELDSGGIVELAESLRREFALVTGETLTLFVDRTAIGWGDEWRRRIDGALAETTFFIPIITPRYFSRDECRRELLEFNAQAQSLGISELILPIRYAKVNDFTEQNADEAISLVARMQYVDWAQLRLKDSSSAEYRTAVNALASRLAEVANVITERQLSDEIKEAGSSESTEPGLAEIFDQISEILPEWIESMEDSQVNTAQFKATWLIYDERLKRAERSGPPSAKFAILQRLAVDELPIAERDLRIARTYAAKTIELDPLVLAAARIGAAHSSEKSIFADLHAGVKLSQKNRADELNRRTSQISASAWARQRAHVSRTMRKLADIWTLYDRTIVEANQIVDKWAEELEWLESTEGQS
jgi:hypothetical protein